MKNRWRSQDAKSFLKKYSAWGEDIALRTYSARLIGQDRELVLHGGGNTSVKTTAAELTGEKISVICVKGSGWDLGTIEAVGHPAIRLEALRRLRSLSKLSDEEMVNQLRTQMLDSSGPNPSVESLLHAFLPHKFVDHTHADAILSLVDQPDAAARAQDWTKGRLAIIPYIMPGFALSKFAGEIFERNPQVEGLLLIKHGIFTFGESAEESYERMIRWEGLAEHRLSRGRSIGLARAKTLTARDRQETAAIANMLRGEIQLRRDVKPDADPVQRMIIRHRSTPAILKFVASRQCAKWSQSGPATPDHVIRTKPKPLLIPASSASDHGAFRTLLRGGLGKFKKEYEGYFLRQYRAKKAPKQPLDPLPRVILVPGAGLFAAAEDARAADIALDIYETTIGIIEKAARVGRYEALPESDIFDMEYWSLEQAKLGKVPEKPFSRKVVWISGAASGIGRAAAQAFGSLGAHLFLTDVNKKALEETVQALGFHPRVAARACDVTEEKQVVEAFEFCSLAFGGVDIVVSNAGSAPAGNLADCPDPLLRKSFELNFFAHQSVARAAVSVFRRQGLGGVLLFNASKSAFNPGPGFGPYTLPKAGVIALMKQYAVELGAEGIRSNAVNADRVRTGLFADGLLENRAAARGVSVKEYLSGNLVKEEVYAEDVASAFVWLAQARKTTGAVIPVDGGNAAAFPR